MKSIIHQLPVQKKFKLTSSHSVRLKAPPNITRACFLLELAILASAFIVFYYISITSTTSVTLVTYEAKSSPYSCSVLSPRSDSEVFTLLSTDVAEFSSCRYSLDGCLTVLSENGLNVCNSNNRQDFLISAAGLLVNDSTCFDLLLVDNYRFCYGEQTDISLLEGDDSQMFPRKPDIPSVNYSLGYYFTNKSGDVYPVSVGFTTDQIISDFLTDTLFRNVFVVVFESEVQQLQVYKYPRGESRAVMIMTINANPNSFYGFSVNVNGVYVYLLSTSSSGIATGTIYSYIFSTGMTSYFTINCGSVSVYPIVSGDTYRYLSSDLSSASNSNNDLYAICSGTLYANVPYSIYKINPITGTSTIYYASISNVSSASGSKKINSVAQIVVLDNYAYLTTGKAEYNLLRVDLSSQPTASPTASPTSSVNNNNDNSGGGPPQAAAAAVLISSSVADHSNISHSRFLSSTQSQVTLQPVENLGVYYTDSYMVMGFNFDSIYFSGGNRTYYNISTSSFDLYTTAIASFFTATYIQVGYAYGICDGNITKVLINPALSTSFRLKCLKKNGIHYQNNGWIAVPSECAGALSGYTSSLEEVEACSALYDSYTSYVSSNCAASFSPICAAAYTNNPPYSCTKQVTENILTVLGASLGNAAAVLAISIILIKFVLKAWYPNGVALDDYDSEGNYIGDHRQFHYLDKTRMMKVVLSAVTEAAVAAKNKKPLSKGTALIDNQHSSCNTESADSCSTVPKNKRGLQLLVRKVQAQNKSDSAAMNGNNKMIIANTVAIPVEEEEYGGDEEDENNMVELEAIHYCSFNNSYHKNNKNSNGYTSLFHSYNYRNNEDVASYSDLDEVQDYVEIDGNENLVSANQRHDCSNNNGINSFSFI